MALTEGVAYECQNTNVDVLLMVAGSTITPTWLKNKPADEDTCAAAMYPEDVAKEGLDQLGVHMSYLVGERNRNNHQRRITEHSRDEIIAELGKMFTHMA